MVLAVDYSSPQRLVRRRPPQLLGEARELVHRPEVRPGLKSARQELSVDPRDYTKVMSPGPRLPPLRVPRATARRLKRVARRGRAPHRDVVRAKIILLARRGVPNAAIARRVGCDEATVRKWRTRFAADPRVRSLEDRARSGRPSRARPEDRCALIKLACNRPPETTLRDVWTYEELRTALLNETGCALSKSEIGRILRAEEIRPHRMRLWLHSPDPDFAAKVARVCALYTAAPKGAQVVCVDEKTCIQALERKHSTRPAAPGREARWEFEYERHGTRQLIAAFDVATGQVFGQLREQRKAEDLVDFMESLAARYPTGTVYVVWDNLNIHRDGAEERWTKFNARHGGRFQFVHTPLHASWVNQIEIWFSILQRRVLRYGEFRNVDEMAARIEAFIRRWNYDLGHPFRWTFRGHCRNGRRRRA